MCLLQRKNETEKELKDQVIAILLEHGADPNINNKEKVRTISIYGQLLVMLQPIASLLMLKNLLLKTHN